MSSSTREWDFLFAWTTRTKSMNTKLWKAKAGDIDSERCSFIECPTDSLFLSPHDHTKEEGLGSLFSLRSLPPLLTQRSTLNCKAVTSVFGSNERERERERPCFQCQSLRQKQQGIKSMPGCNERKRRTFCHFRRQNSKRLCCKEVDLSLFGTLDKLLCMFVSLICEKQSNWHGLRLNRRFDRICHARKNFL